MDIWLDSRTPQEVEVKMGALGQQILAEKEKYLQVRQLDQTLFGEDYEAI